MFNRYSKIEVESRKRFDLRQFLARTSLEQFPYQLSANEGLRGVFAVLIDTPVQFKNMKTESDFGGLGVATFTGIRQLLRAGRSNVDTSPWNPCVYSRPSY